MRKTHTMHGQLPTDPVARFLVENDEITLELAAGGQILVRVSGRDPVTIASLAELPAAVERLEGRPVNNRPDRGAFTPRGTVLKADPDLDLYCLWSSNVDNVVAVGTRDDMLVEGVPWSRITRADLWGSSARWPEMPAPYPIPYRAEGWDSESLIVMEQAGAPNGRHGGVLPRARLADFLRAKLAGDEAAAGALLDPFEDDDPS